MTGERPNGGDLRAKVFRDREHQGNWRVEKMREDGGSECIAVFAGPNARQHAIDYARCRFGDFVEIELGQSYRKPVKTERRRQ
jgi:hypothetical protein